MIRLEQHNKLYLGALGAGLGVLLLSLIWQQGQALTESGTRVLNQAAATFVDNNGVTQDVTSNQVETIIRQVAGIDLVSGQSKPGVPNGQVVFPHVLTNTGNGPDTYEICVGNEAGSFSFEELSVYEDANEDGLADSSTQLVDGDLDGCLDIGPLSPGETFSFVVVAETPDITATNQISQFEVEAISDFDLSLSASNIDNVTLIDGPLIELVKTLSNYTGFAGASGYSVTLEYRNVGTEAATDLTITDILPTQASDGSTGDLGFGMIYTAASAEWQQGAALDLLDNAVDPLSDDDMAVQVGGGGDPASIIYCAYDASCNLSPFGTDQVTIQIDTVPVGGIGSITFEFGIDDGYEDNAVLNNFASFEYRDAADTVTFGTYVSNTVSLVITEEVETPGVVANDTDSNIATGVLDSSDVGNVVSVTAVGQGETAFFTNYIWNSAPAGVDTFDISIDSVNDREGNPLGSAEFPVGTSFTLLREDGQTPLLDTDGNGIPDTGPIESGDYFAVVLSVTMPTEESGNNGGNGWSVTKIATSVADSNITNAVTDRLLSISASTVDLTNDSTGTDGAGLGPEVLPVTTLSIAPGSSDVFQLWVENTSTQPDSYFLDYSDQEPFIVNSLPVGWTVAINADGGNLDCSTTLSAQVTSAFVVLASAKKLFCATVSIADASAAVAATDIYFRVRSDATGALDIKTDAVEIPSLPQLRIETDMTGQVEPGGTIYYPHVISNTGNEPLECVNVSLADDRTAQGWTSSAFLDVDENGALSAGDVLLTDQTLAIGAELRIVISMFAPSTEPYSVVNNTEVSATGYPVGATCASGLLTDEVVDRTTTTNTDMKITKNQALDADCSGIADVSLGVDAASNADAAAPFALTSFSVLPEQCVVYKLVSENQGVSILYNALIQDVVPGFTTYNAAAQACVSQDADACGFINPPANGSSRGLIQVSSAQLLPGGTVTVFFGIKVD